MPAQERPVRVDLGDKLGDTAIGQQHKLLDGLVGLALHVRRRAYRVAIRIQRKTQLDVLQAQRAAVESILPQIAGHLGQAQHVLYHILPSMRLLQWCWNGILALRGCITPIYDALCVLVCQLHARADDSATQPLRHDLSLGRHIPHCREGEAVDARVETTELLAEEVRQHGDHALHKVHTRAAADCLVIQRGVWLHKVGDIRDVDTYAEEPIVQSLHTQSVVEVSRGERVDGEDPD
mmetsp:Transcript_30454/g.54550  ORF Transcript_30454/g.54550 Transcript_30454/m.54550 type:complete len:236 (+) Transcript_30454:399-1106(+)